MLPKIVLIVVRPMGHVAAQCGIIRKRRHRLRAVKLMHLKRTTKRWIGRRADMLWPLTHDRRCDATLWRERCAICIVAVVLILLAPRSSSYLSCLFFLPLFGLFSFYGFFGAPTARAG